MQTIDVVTYFDCTPTGTKSYRKLQPNTTNAVGHKIETMDDWNFSRNQQRNWETIKCAFPFVWMQCITTIALRNIVN